MEKKSSFKQKSKEGKFSKVFRSKKFWFRTLNILGWGLIAAVFSIAFCGLVDQHTNYTFLKHHTAVIVSDSMSYSNDVNTYLPEDVEHIYRGDLVRTNPYKSFDDVQVNDVVLYFAENNELICHRVITKYSTSEGNYVLTRGDANNTDDTPVKFELVRGKVVSINHKAGNFVLFLRSGYFLIGLCGAGFFIFLGMLVAGLLSDKKGDKGKPIKEVDVKPIGDPNKEQIEKKTVQEQSEPNENIVEVSKDAKTGRFVSSKEISKEESNNEAVKDNKTGRFVSKKTTKNLLIPLILVGGSLGAVGSVGGASALYQKSVNPVSFSIGTDTTYYVEVYDGVNYTRHALTRSAGNDKQLEILNLPLQMNYTIRGKRPDGTYFGGTYEHNIAVTPNTTSGLVVSGTGYDYYKACQTGTYDIYFKFTDSTLSTYKDCWVNVDDVTVVYIQNKNSDWPGIRYWGDNVINSPSDFYYANDQVEQWDYKNTFRYYVPSRATGFQVRNNAYVSSDLSLTTVQNNNTHAIWFDNGNGGYSNWTPSS